MKAIVFLFLLIGCTGSFQSEILSETSKKGLLLIIRSQDKTAECLNNSQLSVSSTALYEIEKNAFKKKSLIDKQVILNVLSNCNQIKNN